MRVNESFGDTVNWDLIPESAISTVTLHVRLEPGLWAQHPGRSALGPDQERTRQSRHRARGLWRILRPALIRGGNRRGDRAISIISSTGNYFDETGWRDLSPSRVYQGFGKVGWQNDKTDVDLSYTYADTSLYGNGAVPQSMLDFRREASYTPDYTQNLLNFVNLTGTQFLTDHLLLSGNAYYRQLATGSGQRQRQRQLPDPAITPARRSTARAPAASRADLSLLRSRVRTPLAAASAHRGIGRAADRFAGSVRLEESGHRRRGL